MVLVFREGWWGVERWMRRAWTAGICVRGAICGTRTDWLETRHADRGEAEETKMDSEEARLYFAPCRQRPKRKPQPKQELTKVVLFFDKKSFGDCYICSTTTYVLPPFYISCR